MRRRRRAIIGASAAGIALVAWVFAVSRFTYLSAFAIESVRVTGTDPETAASLEAAASQAIDGAYLGLFPRDSALLYPTKAVEAAVASASPRVARVAVGLQGMHELSVTVEERPPAAIVCPDLPEFDENGSLDMGGNCYLADKDGLLFKPAPPGPDSRYDRYYAPDMKRGAQGALGRYATSTAEFHLLGSFLNGVRAAGMAPLGVLIKPGREYELYAQNPDADKGLAVIYFFGGAELPRELSNLAAFWNKMPMDFEYIDVRYGSNVFYRLTSSGTQ